MLCGSLDLESNKVESTRLDRAIVQGKSVLELGCGRALPGLLSAVLGAVTVTLSDCDQRALGSLAEAIRRNNLTDSVLTRHLLWQRDGDGEETVRHWSDAYDGGSPALEPASIFDVVLASDCLYFTVQEAPLAASVLRRTRRPGGVAVLVVATRNSWGLPSLHRFVGLLQTAGMLVTDYCHPWPWEDLAQAHAVGSVTPTALATTTTDSGEHHVLMATWPAV